MSESQKRKRTQRENSSTSDLGSSRPKKQTASLKLGEPTPTPSQGKPLPRRSPRHSPPPSSNNPKQTSNKAKEPSYIERTSTPQSTSAPEEVSSPRPDSPFTFMVPPPFHIQRINDMNAEQKAVLRCCREVLIALAVHEHLCGWFANKGPYQPGFNPKALFKEALDRPMLTEVAAEHFAYSKVMAEAVKKDIAAGSAPSLIAEPAQDEAENIMKGFMGILQDDGHLRCGVLW